ncbi:MAG: hypothetical protein AAFS04_04230 [Cyanobacteria bacterium J06631_9]
MSDTTAYLAGCATTGVAALVLLVARVGMVSATADTDTSTRLNERVTRIEANTSSQRSLAQADTDLQKEVREELEKQRDLTQQLEEQLQEQETLSESLEEKIREQEEKSKDLLSSFEDYQRSLEDIELEDKIAAATQPAAAAPSTSQPPASVIWLGATLVAVLLLGGGGLILCSVILILQAQRQRHRPVPMPRPMPMPPASGYRYYDSSFLPPAQLPPRRTPYYDYPPSPYDYTP